MISLVGLSTSTLFWLTIGIGGAISAMYLLRLRRRQVVVPYLPLWQKVIKQNQYQSLWQRLRRLLSWILQMALLLLLVLALGDPRLRAELLSGRNLVVVVDTSASMNALDGKPLTTSKDKGDKKDKKSKAGSKAKISNGPMSRLDEAKLRASKLIDSLVGNDRIMLIGMDAEVIPLTPFTSDKTLLRKTLANLTATDTKANLQRALLLAKDATEGRKMADIVVISDGAFSKDAMALLKTNKPPNAAAKPKPLGSTKAIAKAKRTDPQASRKAPPAQRSKSRNQVKPPKARQKRRRRGRKGRKRKTKKPKPIKLPKGLKRRIDIKSLSKVSGVHRKLPRFRWEKVGKSSDNVGFVALSARRRPNNPLQFSVYMELHNFGKGPIEGFVELYVGDLIMETLRVKLKAGERWRHIVPRLTAQGQKLSARLKVRKGKDLLKTDNVAYAVLPKAQAMRVLLVSADNLYLQAALLSDPQIIMKAVGCGQESSVKGEFDIIIYNDCAPKEVPTSGRYVFVNPPLQGTPFHFRTRRKKFTFNKNPIVTEQRNNHTVMQYISLRDINIKRSKKIRLGRYDKALVSSFGQPLIVGHETKQMRAICVSYSLRESDMVLRVAFPLFLRNSLEWLSRGGRSRPPTSRQTGEIWKIPLPSNLKEVALVAPQRSSKPANMPTAKPNSKGKAKEEPKAHVKSNKVLVNDGIALFSGKQSGFYQLQFGKNKRWIAANLSDPEESHIAPGTWKPVQGKVATKNNDLATGVKVLGFTLPIPRPIWLYLLLLVVVLLGLEWMTYNRRITV